MRPLHILPFVLAAVVVPAAVAETEGACANPSSPFRQAWCKGGVQALDQEMERVQRHVVSGLQGPDKRALINAQHEWAGGLTKRCPYRDSEGALVCLTDVYRARLEELKAIGAGVAPVAVATPKPVPVQEPAPAQPAAQPGEGAVAAPSPQLAVVAPPSPRRTKLVAPPPGEGTAAPASAPIPAPESKSKLKRDKKAAQEALYSPEQAQGMEKIARGESAVAWLTRFGGAALTSETLRKDGWNYCALTLDDGPHPVWTPKVLEVLRKDMVVATYFTVGRPAAQHPEIVKAFADEGHEIGNHSYTHPDMRKLSADEQRHELEKTNEVLRGIGVTPKLFRPPFGGFNSEVIAQAKALNMDVAMWSVDSRDWSSRNSVAILAKVKQELTPAPVVLMHATLPATVEALPEVIAEMRARGCRFVTLSEWFAFVRTPPVKTAAATVTPVAAAAPAPVVAPEAAPAPIAAPVQAPIVAQ